MADYTLKNLKDIDDLAAGRGTGIEARFARIGPEHEALCDADRTGRVDGQPVFTTIKAETAAHGVFIPPTMPCQRLIDHDHLSGFVIITRTEKAPFYQRLVQRFQIIRAHRTEIGLRSQLAFCHRPPFDNKVTIKRPTRDALRIERVIGSD